MKKLIVILIVIVLLLLIGFGVWSILTKNTTSQKNTKNQQTQNAADVAAFTPIDLEKAVRSMKKEYKDNPEFNQCISGLLDGCLGTVITPKIAQTDDLRLCDDFVTPQAQESCRVATLTAQARKNKDINICDQLTQEQQASCRNEIIIAEAIAEQNLQRCDALEELQKNNCRINVAHQLAIANNDSAWCEKIPTSDGPEGAVDTLEKDLCKQDVKIAQDLAAPPEEIVPEEQNDDEKQSSTPTGTQ